jgi:hypothetical protein
MSRPTVSNSAEQLYAILSPLAYADERLGWPLLNYCEALAGSLQEVNDYIYGGKSGFYDEKIIKNGSFDDPLNYAVDHWWPYHSGYTTITRDTSVYNTSPASLKADVTAAAVDLGPAISNVKVKPNTTYVLKAKVRGLVGRTWRITVNQYAGINATGGISSTPSESIPGSSDWQEGSFQFTTTPTTNYLYVYIQAVGTAVATFHVDDVRLLTFHTPSNGYPAWGVIMDVDVAPFKALPWLAQFVGVTVPHQNPGETDENYDARVRDYIRATPGFSRGTPEAMIVAAQQYLTGNKEVIIRERHGGAYLLQILTYASQTPDSAAVLKALISQKPAGIVLTYTVLAGQDYQLLYQNNATYQIVYTKYATYQGVLSDQPGT